jgi:hypothetical protein
MNLRSYIDFSNLAEAGNAGITFWGNAEGIGDFHYEFGAFSLTPHPSGSMDLLVNTWLQGLRPQSHLRDQAQQRLHG